MLVISPLSKPLCMFPIKVSIIHTNYVSPPSHILLSTLHKFENAFFCILGIYDGTLLSFAYSLFLNLIWQCISPFVQSLKSFLGDDKLKVRTFLHYWNDLLSELYRKHQMHYTPMHLSWWPSYLLGACSSIFRARTINFTLYACLYGGTVLISDD